MISVHMRLNFASREREQDGMRDNNERRKHCRREISIMEIKRGFPIFPQFGEFCQGLMKPYFVFTLLLKAFWIKAVRSLRSLFSSEVWQRQCVCITSVLLCLLSIELYCISSLSWSFLDALLNSSLTARSCASFVSGRSRRSHDKAIL